MRCVKVFMGVVFIVSSLGAGRLWMFPEDFPVWYTLSLAISDTSVHSGDTISVYPDTTYYL